MLYHDTKCDLLKGWFTIKNGLMVLLCTFITCNILCMTACVSNGSTDSSDANSNDENVIVAAESIDTSLQNNDSDMSHKQQPGEIVFTEVTAKEYYYLYSDIKQIRSCVIYSEDQLTQNAVQPAKKYAEDYFDNHALIFISFTFGDEIERLPTVTNVSCNGRIIYIHADRGTYEIADDAEQWWCTFLEVQKDDLLDTDETPIFDYDIMQVNGAFTRHNCVNLNCIPIEFTEVEPSLESTPLEYDDQRKLKSRLILDGAQLERLAIKPKKAYTSDFFEDHALIFISEQFPCTANSSPKINLVSFNDNVMEIAAVRNPACSETIEWWCTFLEVNKTNLTGADENTFFHFNVSESNGRSSVKSTIL